MQQRKWYVRLLGNEKNIYWIYFFIVVFATFHKLYFSENSFNNFSIFRYAYYNLLQNNNLYAEYPSNYFDIFKYNPTFALLMAPFWWLPKILGLLVWNVGNALLPIYAVNKLKISVKAKFFFAFFILIEMLTSVQNAQSNGLMLGLMLFMFVYFEKQKQVYAALFMALGFFVKLFAVAGALLLLTRTNKRTFIIWGAILMLFGTALPVFIVGVEPLMQQYANWWVMLINDHPHALNYSLMTFIERALGVFMPNFVYLLIGFAALALPLLRRKKYENYLWRLTYFSAILVWVVIFNHKAESPTFVIAMAGAALWLIASTKNRFRIAMIVFVFIFTGLTATDVFPVFVRENYIKPYAIKVLPCILLFIIIIYDLLVGKFEGVEKN